MTRDRTAITPEETNNQKEIPLAGIRMDEQTRCEHYNSEVDIVSIRFPCCDTFYPCYKCHRSLTDHKAEQWECSEFDTEAIYCGNCGSVFTITEYINGGTQCPKCHSEFNAECEHHYERYFVVDEK
ncbi:hypothetical protein K0C01_07575 [Salinarchaeum sp. IM2453]|uniref:CHY zinc finger protein n=1 Tax=Salinarchaeum sp. IM2453 TaxID=2862870 RepID=UPI001C82B718|nr:hypothetical protein K0C01_07575 [Salinarchaeum sp. IM2453]